MGQLKIWAVNLGLALSSLVLGFAVGEIGLRVANIQGLKKLPWIAREVCNYTWMLCSEMRRMLCRRVVILAALLVENNLQMPPCGISGGITGRKNSLMPPSCTTGSGGHGIYIICTRSNGYHSVIIDQRSVVSSMLFHA